jgi:hypothetical protein
VQKLLNAECDVEVLEEIFAVIVGASDMDNTDNNDIVQWIQVLVDLKGFGFNARFFSTELKESVCKALENCDDGSAVELSSRFRSA